MESKSINDLARDFYGAKAGVVRQEVPDTTLATMPQYYSFNMAPGDFVKVFPTANGQSVTALSIDPLTDNAQSVISLYGATLSIPHAAEIEASLSQRTRGAYSVMEVINKGASAPTLASYAISSIQQATTTLTVVFASNAVELRLGDHVNIAGVIDNRLNYHNLVVATKSADGLTFTFTTADDAALPSLTVGPYASQGIAYDVSQLFGASDGYAMRFSGASTTSAAHLSKFGGNETQSSGTFNGNQLSTVGSTAPVWTAAATGEYDLKATTRFAVRTDPRAIYFEDFGVDSAVTRNVRSVRTGVKPAWQGDYTLRFRAVHPRSMTRPVAKIVSAVHSSAATTTVVTMDVAPSVAGLVVGNYVTLRNVRDQTNFVNSATAVNITAVDEGNKQITVAWGAAAIATSYGGSVILQNGGYDQPGIIAQTVNSVARDSAGFVTLVGSAAWSGTQIGEYYNLHGLRDNTNGADLGFDGVYELVNTATTTAVFKPVVESLTGSSLAPAGGVVTTTNCGGSVILRTSLRAHDILVESYGISRVQVDGQGSSDITKAIPIFSMGGTFTTTVSSGTVTANTTETALVAPTAYFLNTAASTNAAVIKATAGTAYMGHFTNTSAAAIHVKLYSKATAPTVGTDVPLVIFTVAANTTGVLDFGRVGKRFGSGIGIAVTGAQATTDTTAIAAGCLISIDYI